jgi:transposase
MDYYSQPPVPRDQLVLFPTKLDDAIRPMHPVRLLNEICEQLDWSVFEAGYHGSRGQPPIPPRILAMVIIYGLMTRIRSSRALEEALSIRSDFRWLAEGRSMDHTTLSEFRRRHADELKNLFIQVGLLARSLGLVRLEQLAYDGTRIRANNRRSGTRLVTELPKLRQELSEKYVEQEQRLAREDAREKELLGRGCVPDAPADLLDTQRRLAELNAAMAEIKRAEQADETIPKRIPLTDPQSRLTPNKDGGFAPNYTPLATVDCQHGFIVGCDVIAMTDEEHYLLPQIEQVQENFGLPSPPAEMLADGLMSNGANLLGLDHMGVVLYSPAKSLQPEQNPALRADPTQPVPADQWDRLPTKDLGSRSGVKQKQLTKDAFIYDVEQDCYWCPTGQRLSKYTSEKPSNGRQSRTRYKATAEICAACPLRDLCLQQEAKCRDVSRLEHDELAEELAKRMSTPEAQTKYARRRHVAERPFAVIKQHFGARRFLLRGLSKVRTEWRWLTIAFNLTRLMSLWHNRAGPDEITLSSLQECRG